MENKEKPKPDESEIIKTIVAPTNWDDALTELTLEHGLDPLDIDIVRLTDAFMGYINRLQSFSFRIPGRFILIAAILLNMKAEAILASEEKRLSRLIANQEIPDLNSPMLTPPPARQAMRPVSLNDLIAALNKAFEIKAKKEPVLQKARKEFPLPMHKTEDIQKRVTEIYENIRRHGKIAFSELVPAWRRKEIIETFLPLLQLEKEGKVSGNQPEPFKEIFIKLR